MLSKAKGYAVDVGVPFDSLLYSICFGYEIPHWWLGPLWSTAEATLMWSYMERYGLNPKTVFGWTYVEHDVEEFKGLDIEEIGYDSLTDFNRYSWGAGEVIRQLSPHKGDQNGKGENQIVHTTIDGFIRPSGSGLYTWTNNNRWWWGNLSVPLSDQHLYSGYTQRFRMSSDASPHLSSNAYWEGAVHSTPLRFEDRGAIFKKLWEDREFSDVPYVPNTGGSELVCGSYAHHGNAFRNFVKTDRGCRYQQFTFAYGNAWMRVSDIEWIMDCDLRAGSYTDYYPVDYCYTTVTLRMTSRVYIHQPGSSDGGFSGWAYHPDQALYGPTSAQVSKSAITSTFMISRVYHSEGYPQALFGPEATYVRALQDLVRRDLHYFRPAIHQAMNDSIDRARSVASNWVESFTELGELMALFPQEDVSRVANYLYAAYKFGASWKGALKTLAKAIAGGYLLYAFGWGPNSTGANELAQSVERISDLLPEVEKNTARGSFSIDHPKSPTFTPSKLVVRTRYKFGDVSGPAAQLLQLDQVGVFPTSSRIWDTFPGSWFIDWIINMSNRYDTLDTYLLMAIMDCFDFVHSYTFTIEIPDEQLLPLGYESSGPDKVKVEVYIRERSIYIPALFDAVNAESFVPDTGPTWQLALALLLQLVV